MHQPQCVKPCGHGTVHVHGCSWHHAATGTPVSGILLLVILPQVLFYCYASERERFFLIFVSDRSAADNRHHRSVQYVCADIL